MATVQGTTGPQALQSGVETEAKIPLDHDKLVRAWGPLIRRRIRRLNRMPPHIEDIIQHVLAAACRAARWRIGLIAEHRY